VKIAFFDTHRYDRESFEAASDAGTSKAGGSL